MLQFLEDKVFLRGIEVYEHVIRALSSFQGWFVKGKCCCMMCSIVGFPSHLLNEGKSIKAMAYRFVIIGWVSVTNMSKEIFRSHQDLSNMVIWMIGKDERTVCMESGLWTVCLLIFSYLEVVSVSPVCWSKPGVGIISPHMGHFFLLQNARELCPRELCLFVALFPRMPSHQSEQRVEALLHLATGALMSPCLGRSGCECRLLWED